MTYEEAAIIVLENTNSKVIWIGKPNIWHDVYDLKHGAILAIHPSDKWKSVYAALKRSKKFKITGKIRSFGICSSRETLHPVFEMPNAEVTGKPPRDKL